MPVGRLARLLHVMNLYLPSHWSQGGAALVAAASLPVAAALAASSSPAAKSRPVPLDLDWSDDEDGEDSDGGLLAAAWGGGDGRSPRAPPPPPPAAPRPAAASGAVASDGADADESAADAAALSALGGGIAAASSERAAAAVVPVDPVAAPELVSALHHVNEWRTAEAIRAALAAGAITGAVGALDVAASADATALTGAVAAADAAPLLSDSTRQLAAVARLVLRIRAAAVAAASPDAIVALLQQCSSLSGAALASVAPELTLVAEDADDRRLCAALLTPIAAWRPAGRVGHYATASLDTSALSQALALADALPPRTPRASSLLASARALLPLRSALVVGDYGALQRGLEAAAAASLVPEAAAELSRYATEVEDRAVVAALLVALQVGCGGAARTSGAPSVAVVPALLLVAA